jgi:hypothetical protein
MPVQDRAKKAAQAGFEIKFAITLFQIVVDWGKIMIVKV